MNPGGTTDNFLSCPSIVSLGSEKQCGHVDQNIFEKQTSRSQMSPKKEKKETGIVLFMEGTCVLLSVVFGHMMICFRCCRCPVRLTAAFETLVNRSKESSLP